LDFVPDLALAEDLPFATFNRVDGPGRGGTPLESTASERMMADNAEP